MAANSKMKLKILYILKILMEKSDEEHPQTVNDLIEELNLYGIEAERKSIYTDIDSLIEFGVDIICIKGRSNKYFIGERDFELPELKLLVDAVQSSRFITHKKSTELIKKIEKLTSVYEAQLLDRHVIISDHVKMENENIYYNVDQINLAINNNKKIKFRYFDYNLDKEQVFRRDGEWYQVSPYALTWIDDNYYMVSYHCRYEGISNFRVDRMSDIQCEDEERYLTEDARKFNVAEHTKKYFMMFSGESQLVKLEVDNSLINVVIDRFGIDTKINRVTDSSFRIEAEVVPTDTFFGWLFMFGKKMKIIAPESVIDQMRARLLMGIENYDN